MRRVLTSPGAQFCQFCGEREGNVAAHQHPKAPRACFTCATRLYNAAVAAAQEAR